MVPLDRALVSSYRLSIVTKSLSAAVWPQFAIEMQYKLQLDDRVVTYLLTRNYNARVRRVRSKDGIYHSDSWALVTLAIRQR